MPQEKERDGKKHINARQTVKFAGHLHLNKYYLLTKHAINDKLIGYTKAQYKELL